MATSGDISIASGTAMANAVLVGNTNTYINSAWHLGNTPQGAASSYSPAPINTGLGTAAYVPNLAAEIAGPGGQTSLDAFLNATKAKANQCDILRKVRLLKTSYPYSSYFYDVTNYAVVVPGLKVGSLDTSMSVTGGDMRGAPVDASINMLWNRLTALREQTVATYTEYYCHSNCHYSHSSRGRR